MTSFEVRRVVDVLAAMGCAAWLEGGWGVDALVGRQTRSHRDLDLAFDAGHEAAACEVLERFGYELKTDWRPVRFELAAPGERFVDMHPVALDADGNGVQAGPDGTSFLYPAASFTTGLIDGRQVNCISADLQLKFHSGYQPRDIDRADIELLRQAADRSTRSSAPSRTGGRPRVPEVDRADPSAEKKVGELIPAPGPPGRAAAPVETTRS